MAKAKSTQPVPPFPSDIDRDAFGHWLSGFTDGEGCFMLGLHNYRRLKYHYLVPNCCFCISLRADDYRVVELIQAYFQCGVISYAERSKNAGINDKPKVIFRIRAIPQLLDVVVPHFDTYHLYAKKKRDFLIWKEAVVFMSTIINRPYRRTAVGRGMAPRWTAEERRHFNRLHDLIRKQRSYGSDTPQLVAPELPEPDDFLFRGIDY